MLADSMASMIRGNKEFVMIGDQKIVYEAALALTAKASDQYKKVLIVKAGTGKSVVGHQPPGGGEPGKGIDPSGALHRAFYR
jgi:hypothetical protein